MTPRILMHCFCFTRVPMYGSALQPWSIRNTGPPCRVGTKICLGAVRTKPRILMNTSLQHLIAPFIETHMHIVLPMFSAKTLVGSDHKARGTRQAPKCPNITPESAQMRALLTFMLPKAGQGQAERRHYSYTWCRSLNGSPLSRSREHLLHIPLILFIPDVPSAFFFGARSHNPAVRFSSHGTTHFLTRPAAHVPRDCVQWQDTSHIIKNFLQRSSTATLICQRQPQPSARPL